VNGSGCRTLSWIRPWSPSRDARRVAARRDGVDKAATWPVADQLGLALAGWCRGFERLPRVKLPAAGDSMWDDARLIMVCAIDLPATSDKRSAFTFSAIGTGRHDADAVRQPASAARSLDSQKLGMNIEPHLFHGALLNPVEGAPPACPAVDAQAWPHWYRSARTSTWLTAHQHWWTLGYWPTTTTPQRRAMRLPAAHHPGELSSSEPGADPANRALAPP